MFLASESFLGRARDEVKSAPMSEERLSCLAKAVLGIHPDEDLMMYLKEHIPTGEKTEMCDDTARILISAILKKIEGEQVVLRGMLRPVFQECLFIEFYYHN